MLLLQLGLYRVFSFPFCRKGENSTLTWMFTTAYFIFLGGGCVGGWQEERVTGDVGKERKGMTYSKRGTAIEPCSKHVFGNRTVDPMLRAFEAHVISANGSSNFITFIDTVNSEYFPHSERYITRHINRKYCYSCYNYFHHHNNIIIVII